MYTLWIFLLNKKREKNYFLIILRYTIVTCIKMHTYFHSIRSRIHNIKDQIGKTRSPCDKIASKRRVGSTMRFFFKTSTNSFSPGGNFGHPYRKTTAN